MYETRFPSSRRRGAGRCPSQNRETLPRTQAFRDSDQAKHTHDLFGAGKPGQVPRALPEGGEHKFTKGRIDEE
jgi:hypothetical protein